MSHQDTQYNLLNVQDIKESLLSELVVQYHITRKLG